jgi:hypothetical protein
VALFNSATPHACRRIGANENASSKPQSLDGSARRNRRRSRETGAVLVVVLLAMIGLLGLGLTGLYLTSGSIQMSSNITMRNQALYVAEAGIQTAKSVLNRTVAGIPNWTPNLNSMLNGGSPTGNPIALPAGYVDQIPNQKAFDPSGCLGVQDDGQKTPGAYLRDDPGVGGCRRDTSAYIDCNYPTSVVHNEVTADNPNLLFAQYMGRYTLYIRQDLAECRKNAPDSNQIVVIRSEGTASDNRTTVVLEVTMSPNPNAKVINTGIASVCPAGASGCDDNSSVQQGIVVAGTLHGSAGAPGAGGDAAGGAPGAGGTTAPSSTSGPSLGGSASGGAAGSPASGGAGGTGGTGGSTGPCGSQSNCSSGQVCCSGTCVTPNSPDTHDKCGPCAISCTSAQTCCSGVCTDLSSDHNNCGQCGMACNPGRICCANACETDPGCPSLAIIGTFGPWDLNYRYGPGQGVSRMKTWLSQHSAGCGAKPLTIFDPSDPNNPANLLTAARLAQYQVIILLDVKHNDDDLQRFLAGKYETCTPSYCGVGMPGYMGNMRDLTTTGEAAVLADWVKKGGGLMTIIGLANNPVEPAFHNLVLKDSGIQYSTTNVSMLGGTVVISGTWGGASQGTYGFARDSFPSTGLSSVITNGVMALRAMQAFEVLPNDTHTANVAAYARGYGKQRIAWNPDKYTANNVYSTIGVAGTFGSGRLNVWGDEWITYDTVWGDPVTGKSVDGNTYTADQYWNNVIHWLGKCN